MKPDKNQIKQTINTLQSSNDPFKRTAANALASCIRIASGSRRFVFDGTYRSEKLMLLLHGDRTQQKSQNLQTEELDSYVKDGGLLVIHFAQYDLLDSRVGTHYVPYGGTGYEMSVFGKDSLLKNNRDFRHSVFRKDR